MHELSIVSALIDQCEDLSKQNKAKSITKVVIKIGVLSGVEPALLKTAFDSFKIDTVCGKADLQINIQPLVIYCNECENTHQIELEQRSIICTNCGSFNTKVIDGEDMMLMQLELDLESYSKSNSDASLDKAINN